MLRQRDRDGLKKGPADSFLVWANRPTNPQDRKRRQLSILGFS